MYKYAIVALAAMSAVSAQDTTATLLLYGFDKQSLQGSIVASDATATTYSLNCVKTDDDSCGIPRGFVLTQGPSTLRYTHSVPGESSGDTQTVTLGCTFTGSDSGLCSVTMDGRDGTSIIPVVTTETFTDLSSQLGPQAVLITAGAGAAAGTNTAASTASPAVASASTTSAITKTSSAAGNANGSSSSSTAGAPAMTGVPWIMGGAAAIVYAAM